MEPDTSSRGLGLYVPETECKLSGSLASGFTRGDSSPAGFPGWDAVNRAAVNIQVYVFVQTPCFIAFEMLRNWNSWVVN